MDDLSNAVRALTELLKDVGRTGSLEPVEAPAAEETAADALRVSRLADVVNRTTRAAPAAPASVGASPNSAVKTALGALGESLLGGSLAGQVVNEVTGTKQNPGASTLSTVLGFLGKGTGIAPAISALVKLFGGGGEDEVVPLPKYAAPPSLSLDAANTAGAGTGLEFDRVRYASGNLPSTTAPAREAAPPTQVVVQVNAMDSRSFMDHSDDIARAVREAILNMHPLTDVVSDL